MARDIRQSMTVIRISTVEDFAELGLRWRDLEQRSAGSFFQSWTWMGCLVAQRFPDPILVEASEDGRVVALALFNRVQRWIGPALLYLGESGNAELDCPYIEQNGVLTEVGREEELTAQCLTRLMSSYDVVLSGIGGPVLAAIHRIAGLVAIRRAQASPFVDLRRLRETGADYLTERSANTRQQVRRSDRFYERSGPIMIQQADSVAAAHAMLDEMATLHQMTWTARGRPGCFARPFFRRFHREILASGVPTGEVMLLKVACGDTPIGILYSFIHRGRVSAYQSGLVYCEHEAQAKPGLTCHHGAIRLALKQGFEIYDFLAGEDRYKRSLADTSHQQIWAQIGCRSSAHMWLRQGMRLFRRTEPEAMVISGHT